jgi:hypothetical protein
MYDTLTLPDLYTLHSRLHDEHMAIHRRMITDGKPVIPVLGDEWARLSAKADEIWEASESVYSEITRREAARRAEKAAADA